MVDYLEVWSSAEPRLSPLEGTSVTIGRLPSNDIALISDSGVSRSHAVLERVGYMWCVHDLGSTNGTFLDGIRIHGDRPLHPNAEIRVGQTRLMFRAGTGQTAESITAAPDYVPTVTPRERDVLLALFRFQRPSDMWFEPASTREMAHALSVSDAAVKQHLLHLYDKFHLIGSANRTRSRLANEALRLGVIQLAELPPPAPNLPSR